MQNGFMNALILTAGNGSAVTDIVIIFDVAAGGVAQLIFEVSTHFTLSPFAGI